MIVMFLNVESFSSVKDVVTELAPTEVLSKSCTFMDRQHLLGSSNARCVVIIGSTANGDVVVSRFHQLLYHLQSTAETDVGQPRPP